MRALYVMKKISVPTLKFGHWHAWENRAEIPNCEYPGVYLLVISNRKLEGEKALCKNASYIGMTNSIKGLMGRWYQFHRAILGNRTHSGGSAVFRTHGNYKEWRKKLFVAALPVICDTKKPTASDLKKMGIITYLEYEAFANFRENHARLNKPEFNTK
jgi:hypothetical protein